MFRNFTYRILSIFMLSLIACQQPKSDVFIPIIEANEAAPETTTLIIKRLSDNKVWASNSERAKSRYIPASTSKIPHTLIALETEHSEPDTLFLWDGQERTFAAWNQNLTLTQAYKRSAAWVYQEIAQSLGRDAMASWLTQFDYGNHNVGTANNVTEYWLIGPLEISTLEQIEFLKKVSLRKLSLSAETYDVSRRIFQNETNGSHTLYAKTGWRHDEATIDIGWFVGWVENDDSKDIYVFALNMDMPHQGDHKKRKPIVMDALKSIGAWPTN